MRIGFAKNANPGFVSARIQIFMDSNMNFQDSQDTRDLHNANPWIQYKRESMHITF